MYDDLFKNPRPAYERFGLRLSLLQEEHGLYGSVPDHTSDVWRDISVQFTELFTCMAGTQYTELTHVKFLLSRLHDAVTQFDMCREVLRVDDGETQLDPADMLDAVIRHLSIVVDEWPNEPTSISEAFGGPAGA